MKNLLTLLLVVLLFSCDYKAEKAELVSQVESLTTEKDSLVNLMNRLEMKIDSINKESNFWFDNEIQGKPFLEMGIKNPKEFIINSLQKKPELIPLKPDLGSQMQFMQVELLGKKWLIAYYEDGHTGGRAIYSYEIDNGILVFKLITSYQD